MPRRRSSPSTWPSTPPVRTAPSRVMAGLDLATPADVATDRLGFDAARSRWGSRSRVGGIGGDPAARPTPAAASGRLEREPPMTPRDRRRPGRLALVGGIALALGLAGIAAAWATRPASATDHDRQIDIHYSHYAPNPSHGPGRVAGHASSCATTIRSTTSGSSATPRSTSGIGRARSRSTPRARPRSRSRPDRAGTTIVTFDDAGTYLYICHLPGHEAYGMVGTLWSSRRLSARPSRPLCSPGCDPCPRRSRTSPPAAGGRSGLAGPALLGSRLLTKDLAFPYGRTRGVRPSRAAARPRPDHRRAGRARARAPPPQGRRARAVHRAGRAPGSQRDALLPPARRPPRRVPADRLHAHRRAGVRGVQPHHPADARHLDHPGRSRPDPGAAAPGPVRGRPADRRHRQRADPGSRRPGRRRDGHPDRQARAVHGGLRHPPGPDPAGLARRRHRQPGAAGRSALPRATGRPRLRGPAYDALVEAFVGRGRGRSGRAASSSGRTSSRPTRCGSSTGIATGCPRSTTTSRGRRRWSSAGVLAGLRATGTTLAETRVVLVGAGAAGIGIGRLLRLAMLEAGMSDADARRAPVTGRFARPGPRSPRGPRPDEARAGVAGRTVRRVRVQHGVPGLVETIERVRPTVLVGTTGVGGTFAEAVHPGHRRGGTQRPIVLPLSNPTSAAEATPLDVLALDGWPRARGDRLPVRRGRAWTGGGTRSARPTTSSSSRASGSGPIAAEDEGHHRPDVPAGRADPGRCGDRRAARQRRDLPAGR